MKRLAPALLIALTVNAVAPLPATAQHSGRDGERYDEPSRFPVLRKAFRQIRSDLRYHAGAIRDTASDIRHDVKSTIRGEAPRPIRESRFGYRHDTAQAPRPPATVYDRYEEERPTRTATKRRPSSAPRREPSPEPKIVAPKKISKPEPKRPSPPEPEPTPKRPEKKKPASEKKPDPKPEPEPKPDPESKPEPGPEATPQKKPAVGKVEYPLAKPSDRPGFHYSPYEPFELLDTQGIAPGELARDPGNGKIFRIPK